MSNDSFTNDNGTPRSSHISPSVTLLPAWAPPKAPLPPHRLAKLANALGVSTPVPAVHHNTSFMSRSLLDTPGPLDTLRRSPTPSTAASIGAYSPSVSKYLLHVIPPLHLPHESEQDSYVTPPPATVSGYHTQFRRGILVPLHSTLQAQLLAIAKEYALPSTAGLILYLVSSAKIPPQQVSTPHTGLRDDEGDEPGPRLSEDIWKHLWTRVTKAEQRDDYLLPPSRSHTPNMFSLSNGAQSTPLLLQESNGQPLRPFLSIMGSDPVHPQPLQSPFTPSPSTPSTISDIRSHTKSAPPSSSSVSLSDPGTPDTSTGSHSFARDLATRKESFDLPGLSSPSIIPVLAKVEFDIDRRRAAWYDPWLRSRRMNHVKRTESRAGRKFSVNEGEENPQEKHPPVSLVTGNKESSDLVLSKGAALLKQSMLAGYEPLPDTRDDELSEGGGTNGDGYTARLDLSSVDPLADVFGTDADTWEAMQSSSKRKADPSIVPLALNAADLTALPSPSVSEFEHLGKEEDEVQDLLDQMARPRLSVTNPRSPPTKRSSSPAGVRKHVPPPLVIVPNAGTRDLVVPTESSPMPSSAGSIQLAYLHGSSSGELPSSASGKRAEVEDDEFVTFTRVRSPEENEKREGVVFDDLDLGLDPTEDYDDGDPNDRRRSQFLMKAQLDEIERAMARLSPRILHTDLTEEQDTHFSAALSPNSSLSLSPGKWNKMSSPRLPRQSEMMDNSNRDSSESKKQAAWPAVPFASLSETPLSSPPSRPDGPLPPPTLAVNGVTTSAPTSFVVNSRSSMSEMSAETEMRKRALEEEHGHLGFTSSAIPMVSPIIPLSPDPFGRFSSTPDGRSSTYWESDPPVQPSSSTLTSVPKDAHNRTRSTSSAATSRFSVDSVTLDEPAAKPASRSTLMTVNTIKRFWRKSGKNTPTPNDTPPPTPTSAGGRTSTQIPQRPERPSQEQMELPPTTPTMGRFSPQLAPPRPSKELPPSPQPQQLSVPQLAQQLQPRQQLPVPELQQWSVPHGGRSTQAIPIVAAQMQSSKGSASMDRLHFDQETPYPIRRMLSQSPQLTPPSNLPSPDSRFSDLPLPNTPPPAIPSTNPPPPPEKEKPSARKSILKGWKSATSSATQPPPVVEPRSSIERSSMERPNANGAIRSKRPNVLNFGSSRRSMASPPPPLDIPPSPQIPQQYINPPRHEHRQSMKSRLMSGSVDLSNSNLLSRNRTLEARPSSPQQSMRSSRSSQDTRPSFDTSQFEIVSPKMNSTLSYPYHDLES